MAHTLDRCEHDGIKWFPRGTVEKYSPDQSAFAEAKLADQLSWRRRPLVVRFGLNRLLGRELAVARLHGDWLRDLFPAGPELGYGYTEGNSLVNGGLDALANLVVGSGTPQALVGGATPKTICGVGSGTNATTATMTALQLDGTAANGSTGAFYQSMDANYPVVDGTVHGQLDGQATVTGSNGNLNWQEWCWASSTVVVGATTGATLASVPATGTKVMFNRWTGTSLGTKGSGATWVFSTTITFSLSQVLTRFLLHGAEQESAAEVPGLAWVPSGHEPGLGAAGDPHADLVEVFDPVGPGDLAVCELHRALECLPGGQGGAAGHRLPVRFTRSGGMT